MLSLFKRKSAVRGELTFKTRVEQFWEWYEGVAPRFYRAIEAGKCANLAPEVSAKVDELIPGLAWVFGPGAEGRGHSFTLSGEGVLHRQLLAAYWLSRAPILEGWTLYASRQPGSIDGAHMEIGGRRFDPLEFWVTPFVNGTNQKVDVTVWHPLFDQMEERQRWTVLFLFLDEVLGEYGTQQWIGEIKLNPGRLADSIPLRELRDYLQRVQDANGWKKLPPGEETFLYSCEERQDRFLRDDIITGISRNMGLNNEYAHAEGELEDPLAGSGADYVFVAFDATILPDGQQVTARGEIEDALDSALVSATSGRLIGGAFGTRNAYIDLLLFDGRSSIGIVMNVLRERCLPPGTTINYFAKEKRGWRVVL
jgi:hypothetical protein